MHSLKQQLLLLVIGPILLLALCMTVLIGIDSNKRAHMVTTEKARSDLAAVEALIDLKYPGDWSFEKGNLYKGKNKMSNNLHLVDYLAKITGDTVTIFLEDTRVATTVRKPNGERAIGTKVSDEVATTVLKNGQTYLGEANVVGENHLTAYKPISDKNGKIIGILYVGISKQLSTKMIRDSLITIILVGSVLTLIVGFGAWFFTQRMIVGPLQQITEGTQVIASKGSFRKVDVEAHNEIGDLATAFNQMVDGLQELTKEIKSREQKTFDNSVATIEERPNPIQREPQIEEIVGEELPKGINEATLRQIITYLATQDEPLSAEEIGEGVNLTRVTVRRYLEFLEQVGLVDMDLKYGTVGRPVKLYLRKQ